MHGFFFALKVKEKRTEGARNMGNIKARVYAKKIQEKGDEQDIGLIVVVSGTKRTALRMVYK